MKTYELEFLGLALARTTVKVTADSQEEALEKGKTHFLREEMQWELMSEGHGLPGDILANEDDTKRISLNPARYEVLVVDESELVN
jgi:hypothetical protein